MTTARAATRWRDRWVPVLRSYCTGCAETTWQRLERGADPPHAYAVSSTRDKVAEIAKAQADGRVPDRFEARVLLGLIIHIPAFWPTSNPDVLAVMNVSAAKRRRDVVRDAVAALLA